MINFHLSPTPEELEKQREEKKRAYKKILIDFFPVLENVIKQWDGKLLNKKFYLALKDAVKIIQKENNCYWDLTSFWLDGDGGARVVISWEGSGFTGCEILKAYSVKDYAVTEPGRRPRVSSLKMLAILKEEKK